ncbi:MAG: SipW-dependent-type signal peptide-containing protein [Haloplanus sp.]
MSGDRFELSRRKALAALGTIGVASAGAGLGTSAYFSDQETFQNNQLTAGTLDLGVGYSSHYYDGSTGVDSLEMYTGAGTGDASDLPDGKTGMPSNDAWLVAVDDADADTFLSNTSTGEVTNQGCAGDGADVVGALTQADGESAVIDLADVKPGDFGEVTFDLELCSNPGYVWANNPNGFTADENGVTEPEADDPDEESGTVELLDAVQAAVWLDDGNNYQNGGERPLLVDSLRNVLSALNSGNGVRIDGSNTALADAAPEDFTRVGVNRFDVDGDGTYDADIDLDADPVDSGSVAHATSGGTATTDYVTSSVSLPSGTTLGDVNSNGLSYEYVEGSGNEQSDPDEVYLLLEDDAGARRVVWRTWNDGDDTTTSWTTREVGAEVTDGFAGNSGRNWSESGVSHTADLTDDGDISLANTEVLAMAVGRGNTSNARVLDVYYRNPSYNSSSLGEFPTSCFRGETAFSAVFAWWLPVDHANEVQSDTVEFDLGFYTEQCRHNDGAGMNNAAVSPSETDDTNTTAG